MTLTEMNLDLKVQPSGQEHCETFKTPLSFFLYICSILLRDCIKSPFLASPTKPRYFDFLYVKGYSRTPIPSTVSQLLGDSLRVISLRRSSEFSSGIFLVFGVLQPPETRSGVSHA